MKPRPGNAPTGMVSTMKMSFSFGSHIASVEFGVVEAVVFQLELGAAEIDRPAVAADHLVGQRTYAGP